MGRHASNTFTKMERLGSIQPIGGEPGKFKPSSSYVYGVGAFLLAGSELSQLLGDK